jgi:hypothetical protein
MLLNYIKNIISLLIGAISGEYFWNYRIYKKYATNQNNNGAFNYVSTGQFAIVIQGPYISNEDFTFETIKIYRNNFPDAILILSTWPISTNIIDSLKRYDVHVIQNKIPVNPGISNINLQIVTSAAGVLLARKLDAQFVLKTRTDQRIYHPSLETYLSNLLKAFPLKDGLTKQVNRLVGISLGTFRYRLYGISDMFLYGHIDDMIRYWNIPLDKRNDSTEERNKVGLNTWRTFSTWRVCEIYLCTEFLKKIARNITYTLEDSFQVFKDHFVVIDQAAIKLYWHKYTINTDRYENMGFFDPELSFNDWLTLYHSIDNIIIDESTLDQKISKTR